MRNPVDREEARRACLLLGRHFGFDQAHSLQDAKLALRLYDLLEELHELPPEARDLLLCASLLHDIGYAEGYEGHHKTAYRLIMQADIPGLTEQEKHVVANVARYHRGARPSTEHPGFASLPGDDQEVVKFLAAILRLADGLDRGHRKAVHGLSVRFEPDRLVILLQCPHGCDAEVWAGEKKGQMLGDMLGAEVDVREVTEGDRR